MRRLTCNMMDYSCEYWRNGLSLYKFQILSNFFLYKSRVKAPNVKHLFLKNLFLTSQWLQHLLEIFLLLMSFTYNTFRVTILVHPLKRRKVLLPVLMHPPKRGVLILISFTVEKKKNKWIMLYVLFFNSK